MDTKRLGNSGLLITRLGLGRGRSAGQAGNLDGEARTTACDPRIREALDWGINWIDTAAVYGLGHSEEMVARALRHSPKAVRVHEV